LKRKCVKICVTSLKRGHVNGSRDSDRVIQMSILVFGENQARPGRDVPLLGEIRKTLDR
jgi:hypothetical protein